MPRHICSSSTGRLPGPELHCSSQYEKWGPIRSRPCTFMICAPGSPTWRTLNDHWALAQALIDVGLCLGASSSGSFIVSLLYIFLASNLNAGRFSLLRSLFSQFSCSRVLCVRILTPLDEARFLFFDFGPCYSC